MSGTTVGAIATEKIENTALKSDTHALGGEYTVSEAVYSNSELVQYAADWLTGELIFVNNEDYVKNESVYGVYYSNISMDLYLPDKAQNGCEIVWESSFPDIIDIYGKVTRPGYLDSTDWSILTATISMGEYSETKTFEVYVNKLEATADELAVKNDSDALHDYMLHNDEMSYMIFNNLTLPDKGAYASTITWTSSNEDVVKPDGTVGKVMRPPFSEGDKDVVLTATFRMGDAVLTKDYHFTIIAQDASDEQLALMVADELTYAYILSGNKANDVKTDLLLPTSWVVTVHAPDWKQHTIYISWASSDECILKADGTVIRPQKNETDKEVLLTATLTYGEAEITKTFDLIVTKMEQFPLAIYMDSFSDAHLLQQNCKTAIVDSVDEQGQTTKALQFVNNGMGGSAFTTNKIYLGEDLSFSTMFSYRINGKDKITTGSGGFTFTLQAQDNIAYSTGIDSLGVEGIQPSLSIQFDGDYGWQESGGSQGSTYFANTKVAAFVNGDRKFLVNPDYYTIPQTRKAYLNGTPQHVWIEYDGQEKRLAVRVSDDTKRPREPLFTIENIDLAVLLTQDGTIPLSTVQDMYAGFTGSAGNAGDINEILCWYLKNDAVPIDFAPYSFIDASRVLLSANPPAGASTSVITATVSGEDGIVDGIPVYFSTTLGELSDEIQTTNEAGSAFTTLSTLTSGTALVRATAQGGATALFEVPLAISSQDVLNWDFQWLNDTIVLNGNAGFDSILTHLNLPKTAPGGSTILWRVNVPDFVNPDTGEVTTPTPEQDDQDINLTAVFTNDGIVENKTYPLTVRVPDSHRVEADVLWLTGDLILDGDGTVNLTLEGITEKLNLPVQGEYKSEIQWTSSAIEFITTDGTVIRPSYTRGDQRVTLSAEFTKGNAKQTVSFECIVKALPATDEEAVEFARQWLTNELILNENQDFENIITDMYLPTKGPEDGPVEINLTWSSSEPTVIATDGKVTQYSFTRGVIDITLTVKIRRGTVEKDITYAVKVIPLPQTDAEAVEADSAWLSDSIILWTNPSRNSVTNDLNLPYTGKYATITWASDNETLIGVDGKINRPHYSVGHQKAKLTATITVGDKTTTKTFEYTVLAIPDTDPPQLISSNPMNNAVEVNYQTREILLTFNENVYARNFLEAVLTENGVKMEFYARAKGNTISLLLSQNLSFGATYHLVVKPAAVCDYNWNHLSEKLEIVFTAENIQEREIQLSSTTPQDRQIDVETRPEMQVRFNVTDLTEGPNFRHIKLYALSSVFSPYGIYVKDLKLSEGIATLTPGYDLQRGSVYQLVIPEGAVVDRFGNVNQPKTVVFRTKASGIAPEVSSVYPNDGQTHVNIQQSMIVHYSEEVKLAYPDALKLMDDAGKNVPIAVEPINPEDAYFHSIKLRPLQPLKPDTQYTVIVGYDAVRNRSGKQINFAESYTFSTGNSPLTLWLETPNTSQNVPVESEIHLAFSEPVLEGEKFDEISLINSGGIDVPVTSKQEGNKVVIQANVTLTESETYTLYLPSGAYQSTSGANHDDFSFTFHTATPVEVKGDFRINPSSMYLQNKPLSFHADTIEQALNAAGHSIAALTWNFGDGQTGTQTEITHTYDRAGTYPVILDIVDDKGYSYNFKRDVGIEAMKDKMKLQVSPTKELDITNADYRYQSHIPFVISLDYNGVQVPDEEVRVTLYKNGLLRQDFGTITTNSSGNATFRFNFWKNYWGTYELVFHHPAAGEVRRTLYIDIDRVPKTKPVYFSVEYHSWDWEEKGLVENVNSINILLDGEKNRLVKQVIDDRVYYVSLTDIPEGEHTLEVPEANSLYITTKPIPIYVTHDLYYDSYIPIELEKRLITTGDPYITRVWTEKTDSARGWQPIYEGTIESLALNISCEWNGHPPAYFEYRTGNKVRRLSIHRPTILLDPGKVELRMVSALGVESEWFDTRIYVTPKPAGGDITVDADGHYRMDFQWGLKQMLGDKVGKIADFPLLDHDKSFGMPSSNYLLNGILDRERFILSFGGSGSYGRGKTTGMVSTGFDVSAEVDGYVAMVYNRTLEEWSMEYGSFGLKADGKYYWKKKYTVPIIKVGITRTLTLGSRIYGRIVIDRSMDSEYAAILAIQPYAAAEFNLDLKVYEITGYLEGNILADYHIPTGYMSVDADIVSYIKGKSWIRTRTFFSKKLDLYDWNNGKEKLPFSLLSLDSDYAGDDYSITTDLLSRSYLHQNPQWIAQDELDQAAGLSRKSLRDVAAANPSTQTLKSFVYPDTEPKLIQEGDKLWMIWNDDNPERTSENRTQMMFAVKQGGAWSEPEWIGADNTADFEPTAAAIDGGVLLAWQDMKRELKADDAMADIMKNAEIRVTNGVVGLDSDVSTLQLTMDEQFDHSPMLAADGNQGLLVWTKSEGSHIPSEEGDTATNNRDRLMFSDWNGSTWSDAKEIAGDLSPVMASSLAMHGGEGLLLYVLDTNNDLSTNEDQELFARTFKNGEWSEEIPISNNSVVEMNPKAIYCNDDWFITWHQEEGIYYRTSLMGSDKTEAFLAAVEDNYEITVNEGGKPQVVLVYKRLGIGNTRSLSISVYDYQKDKWSDEIELTEAQRYIDKLSAVFTEDGKLNIAYVETDIIIEAVDGNEFKVPGNTSEVKLLTYTPIHDLALSAQDELGLSSSIPVPETMTNVSVTVHNLGDYAEDATVHLYNGDPKNGGKLLGTGETTEPIAGRSSGQVQLQWLVDAEIQDKYDLYAVAELSEVAIEADGTNNTVQYTIQTADISVERLDSENVGYDDYQITTVVKNTGVRALKDVDVKLENETGDTFELWTITEMRPGQEIVLSTIVHDLSQARTGEYMVSMTAQLDQGIEEYSTENNSLTVILDPMRLEVMSSSVANKETGVAMNKPFSFTFNMRLDEDMDPTKIWLEDDALAVVDSDIVVEGNKLVITPKEPLDYLQAYRIVISEGALESNAGHSLSQDYTSSFTTMSANPEVVFVWPGHELDNVAINERVGVKFNQPIEKGPLSSEIGIYDTYGNKVSATITTQDEWLYIQPNNNLKARTEYDLVLSAGSIQNTKEMFLLEDLHMSFITVADEKEDDGDKKDGKDNGGTQKDVSTITTDATEQYAYCVIKHTVNKDGTRVVEVTVTKDAIHHYVSNDHVLLDLTDALEQTDTIHITLDDESRLLLLQNEYSITLQTGRAQMTLSADWLKSILKDGSAPITITVGYHSSDDMHDDLISDGLFDFSILVNGESITDFDQEIKITLALISEKVDEPQKVIVCVYDETTNTWQPLGGVVDESRSAITFTVNHFSTFAAFEMAKTFDDIRTLWGRKEIEILSSRRLVNGIKETTFAPDNLITRAEFTALIVRTLYRPLSSYAGVFNDVDHHVWYADIVQTANELGLVKGNGKGGFDPDDAITREQLAVLAYRLYQYKASNQSIPVDALRYDDKEQISDYAADAVRFVTAAEIMQGNNNLFSPKRNTTRQEAVAVLYRLLAYMKEL